jgi:hypothetical protein
VAAIAAIAGGAVAAAGAIEIGGRSSEQHAGTGTARGQRVASQLTSFPSRKDAFRLPVGQVHSSLLSGRSMTFFSG